MLPVLPKKFVRRYAISKTVCACIAKSPFYISPLILWQPFEISTPIKKLAIASKIKIKTKIVFLSMFLSIPPNLPQKSEAVQQLLDAAVLLQIEHGRLCALYCFVVLVQELLGILEPLLIRPLEYEITSRAMPHAGAARRRIDAGAGIDSIFADITGLYFFKVLVNPHPTKVGCFQHRTLWLGISFKEMDCLSTIRPKLR